MSSPPTSSLQEGFSRDTSPPFTHPLDSSLQKAPPTHSHFHVLQHWAQLYCPSSLDTLDHEMWELVRKDGLLQYHQKQGPFTCYWISNPPSPLDLRVLFRHYCAKLFGLPDPCLGGSFETDPTTGQIRPIGCIPAIVNRALLECVFEDDPMGPYWSEVPDPHEESLMTYITQEWIIPLGSVSFASDDIDDSASSLQAEKASDELDVFPKP
jgi:hypothetical protein